MVIQSFQSERSVLKVMATILWSSKGVLMVDYLEGKKKLQDPIMLKF